jgi:hypothetical protein
MFAADRTDWAAMDRQIDRDTANWKRSVALYGIPKPAEVRQKISAALKGRRLAASTKIKISASLREYHTFRKAIG